MAESKHTPGPWTVEGPMGPDQYAIVQDGLTPYEWQFIATVSVGTPAEGLMPRQEAKANARLIAAAPELLEALRKAEAHICRRSGGGETDFRAELNATIAKAEGR